MKNDDLQRKLIDEESQLMKKLIKLPNQQTHNNSCWVAITTDNSNIRKYTYNLSYFGQSAL